MSYRSNPLLALPLLLSLFACASDIGGGADNESSEAQVVCGDGQVTASEDCDDGNTSNGDGCDSSCHIEVEESVEATCGDGVLADREDCDDGNLLDGDGCDAECQTESLCGDGNLDADEQCDDGNIEEGDGCDSTCLLEGSVCGNAEIDSGESCDDGNLVNYDGCSNVCQEEGCGDGQLQPGEECDDGNLEAGDGCSATCLVDAGLCEPQFEATCNSSDTWSTTSFGSTNNVDTYSCNALDESGREYTYYFAPLEDTTMSITLTPAEGLDLDLFLLSDDGNELCEGGDCALYADDTIDVVFAGGGEYWIVVDGYQGAEGDYSINFDCPDEPVLSCPQGEGNNGESCADVYDGDDIWRCTISPALDDATVSQVCRDMGNGPIWYTFHINPSECCACDGEFDVGCCAVDSGSSGCP